jgi:lysophospholipase L1-like esterase
MLCGMSFADSRGAFSGTLTGPNVNDGLSARSTRSSLTNQSHVASIPFYYPNLRLVADGGASGDVSGNWDSGSRLAGRTITALAAIPSDVVFMPCMGINDVHQNVSSAATRDSVAAAAITNNQDAINYWLSTGRKIVWQPLMQSSAAAFGVNAVLRRDCVDLINATMVPWVQALANVAGSDIRPLVNDGGALTGAYLSSTASDDGTHLNNFMAQLVAHADASALQTLYPHTGWEQMLWTPRPGTNLIHDVSATTVLGVVPTGCTVMSGPTYSTDALGRKRVKWTVRIDNASNNFKFEVHADVGSVGGRTPQNVILAGDVIKAQLGLEVHDGARGNAAVSNVYAAVFVSYDGGSPAAQSVTNGAVGQGSGTYRRALLNAPLEIYPFALSAGSDDIAGPSAGTGMRFLVIAYGATVGQTCTIECFAPEIRVGELTTSQLANLGGFNTLNERPMTMSKTNTWETGLLDLVFTNVDFSNVGDATGLRGSSTAGSLYFSLHTADPGEAGDQTTNEIAYTSYARVAVARSTSGWTVTGNAVALDAAVVFPAGTGGSGTATHFGIGTASSGAGKLLYKGALSPNIVCGNGVTPQINAGTVVTED